MRTKVTKKWLESQAPRKDVLAYWCDQKKTDLFDFTRQCIKDDRCEWANWLMVRCMDRKQYLRYALYAVKQVEPMHRKQHPDSDIVTGVLRAVSACIKDDSDESRAAAKVAADAVIAAADDAITITIADYAAAVAAYRAARAAAFVAYHAAASAASATAYAAANAADTAARVADADYYCDYVGVDYRAVYAKMLRYGMRIMKEDQKCERK